MALEDYGLKTGVMPVGGWYYIQTNRDGGTQRLPYKGCAGTGQALVSLVKDYRIQAHIDLGDAEGDVAEFIKRNSPMNDRFPNKTPKKAKGNIQGFRPLIERILEWLLQVGAKEPRLLIEDEADARAEICLKCPQNVDWRTGCAPCCEKIVSRAQNLRQRPKYKHDDQLGACRLHDLKISAAVFIDRDDLPPVNPNAPAECWMRSAV